MGIEYTGPAVGLPIMVWSPPPAPDPSPLDRCTRCGIYRRLSPLEFVGYYTDGEAPEFECIDRYGCVRRGDLMKNGGRT